MNEIIHSTEALNVLSRFYGKRYTVFVEGQDDLLFWKKLFNYIIPEEVNIEIAGGLEELNKYCKKIIDENAQIIVAMDNDHNRVINNREKHNRIIYTYGYSIENTLYCNSNINRIIQNIYRTDIDLSENISKWKEGFCKNSKELLIYDILNYYLPKSIAVFGDNCCRFLVTQNSANLSRPKIDAFINTIKNFWTVDEIEKVNNLLENEDIWYCIKGHFITNAVINFVKYEASKYCGIKTVKIFSLDHLYSSAIDGCYLCPSDKYICKDMSFTINEIRKAVEDCMVL